MKNSNSDILDGNEVQDHSFYSNITIISWILMILTAMALLFYSSSFYLGTEDDLNKLKEELLKNFTLRSMAYGITGLPTLMVIAIIELFVIRKKQENYRVILKKLSLAASIVLLASFIGSAIFFLA